MNLANRRKKTDTSTYKSNINELYSSSVQQELAAGYFDLFEFRKKLTNTPNVYVYLDSSDFIPVTVIIKSLRKRLERRKKTNRKKTVSESFAIEWTGRNRTNFNRNPSGE